MINTLIFTKFPVTNYTYRMKKVFKTVKNQVSFVDLEHDIFKVTINSMKRYEKENII